MARVMLHDHDDWLLERSHMLGHNTIEQMADGLPSPFQKFMQSWEVRGEKLAVPFYEAPPANIKIDRDAFHVDDVFRGRGNWLGAILQDGTLIPLGDPGWTAYYEKWLVAVCEPMYGFQLRTQNLGMAILTNINLFKMALKYKRK